LLFLQRFCPPSELQASTRLKRFERNELVVVC
jgi:hypothetical protein